MKQILCYGDSNTWGLIPGTLDRYPWGVRWTSVLQEKVKEEEVRIAEEGLCGRTTVFEDAYRKSRNGLETLSFLLESHNPDAVVLMLGTNDCKSHYNNNAYTIAKGVEQCVETLLERISAKDIVLVSPILLGEEVYKEEFDPEFGTQSVQVAKHLKEEYEKVAKEKGVWFLAASDYVAPSKVDQEHMDEASHTIFAETIYGFLKDKKII